VGFHVLVLAGGSGTRLWPLSRTARPKHLLPLGQQGQTLLSETLDRVAPLADSLHVVTAADQADSCRAALGPDSDASMIIEPSARGTGPALGLAVHQIARDDPQAVIASVHADHDVADVAAYRAAVLAAAGWAAATDGLAAVGLTPTFAATGFGYIEVGDAEPADAFVAPPGGTADPVLLTAAASLPAAHAFQFVEKPSAERAGAFLVGRRHLWNLGLFAWTAPAFLAELLAADPALDARLLETVTERSAGREDAAARIYSSLSTVAVEPLVFEGSGRLTVVRASFGWSDLGSWSDLLGSRAALADAEGNVVTGDAILVRSRGCLVESRAGRTIAVVGCEGLVVVDTGDAVLVMPSAAAQQVKTVVDELRARGRTDLL